MTFDFPEYRVEPSPAAPGRTSLYRPVIRVRMSGQLASRTIWALLDTGADECYITEDLATKLGVSPISDDLGLINSASGEMRAWYGALSIGIAEGEERYDFALVVGVVPQDWSEMILGRTGFFEHFDANFSDVDRKVTLTARNRSV